MSEVARVSVVVTARTSEFMRGMNNVSTRMANVGRTMTRIGGKLTRYVTLPIIGIGTAAVTTAMQFEHSMAKIEALVGVSREQLSLWEDDIKNIAREFGIMPTDLADALYFITSAGLEGADALDALYQSAKASGSGLGDVKTIADLVTSAMNAYGAENLSAAEATDILVAAVREGKAEPYELASSLGQVLPIAAELGIEFHEVAAATAAMTRTGTNAQVAGTQLRQIMATLLKPTADAEEVLSEMGTSAKELREMIREDGLLAALMELRDLTNEYGEDAMARVFPNIRALIGILDLMGENVEENIEIFKNLEDAVGALDDAWKVMADTTIKKWDKMKATVMVGLIELGDVLLPIVAEYLDIVTENALDLADAFAELSEEEQKSILGKIGMAAAAGPLLSVLGNLVIVIAGIVKLLSMPLGFLSLAVLATEYVGNWARKANELDGVIGDLVDSLWAAISPVTSIIKWSEHLISFMRGNRGTIDAWRDAFGLVGEAIWRVIEAIGELQRRWSIAFGGGNFSAGGNLPSMGGGGARGDSYFRNVPHGFHTGGTFRAPRLGGEGLALLKDQEKIIPAGVDTQSQHNIFNIDATYNVTDQATAEYANNDLVRKLKRVGLGGANR